MIVTKPIRIKSKSKLNPTMSESATVDAAVDGLAALSVSDDDSWETPRGVESWVATPRGGFALSPAKLPPLPGENSSSAANVVGKKPSIAEIKAAGRAKVKAQQEAVSQLAATPLHVIS